MKKIYFLLSFLVVGFSSQITIAAAEDGFRRGYEEAFIFEEGGVEFAVFPDGQFDFFFNPRRYWPGNISYNAGFNYGPFVQYDDFGAVIQIENVPVFYDFYGRIIEAGRVQMDYNRFGMLSRVGNLFLHYDRFNRYSHYSGYINSYNPYYVYRPWHDHFVRPQAYSRIVYHQPYRAYYYPERLDYSYHRKYYKKYHQKEYPRSYYRPGDQISSYHRGRRLDSPREDREEYVQQTRSTESRSNSERRIENRSYPQYQERALDQRAEMQRQPRSARQNEAQYSGRNVEGRQNDSESRIERNVQEVESSVDVRRGRSYPDAGTASSRTAEAAAAQVSRKAQLPEEDQTRNTRSDRGRN